MIISPQRKKFCFNFSNPFHYFKYKFFDKGKLNRFVQKKNQIPGATCGPFTERWNNYFVFRSFIDKTRPLEIWNLSRVEELNVENTKISWASDAGPFHLEGNKKNRVQLHIVQLNAGNFFWKTVGEFWDIFRIDNISKFAQRATVWENYWRYWKNNLAVLHSIAFNWITQRRGIWS